MKKCVTAIMAFLYLVVSSGLVVEIHYCMGKKVGSTVKVTDSDEHLCGKCGMKGGNNKCCRDEIKFYKIQDSHKQVSGSIAVKAPELPATVVNPVAAEWYIPSLPVQRMACNSPPDQGEHSLCILNCVFRI